MNMKFPAILVTVLALAACGGGGGGSSSGTGPQAPQVYDDANSYFIAKTSTLEKLTAAQKSGNTKSLYASALNEFYMIEKAKAGKTVDSSAFLEKGDVVAALVNPSVNPGAIKAADKMPDDADVINNFIDAATAYDTEMAKHLYSKDNSNLGWKGTYKGTAIVRNVNVDNTENTVSYNWIDKGNATLEITSASVGMMNSDLKVDTEIQRQFEHASNHVLYICGQGRSKIYPGRCDNPRRYN